MLPDFDKILNNISDEKLKYLGVIHNDPKILEFELNEKNLLNLPDD